MNCRSSLSFNGVKIQVSHKHNKLAITMKIVPCMNHASATAQCTQENTGEWLQQVPLSVADIA